MTDMDTWNILIVDDEKEITDLLEVYLSSEGYRVFKFYCGQDALDCIEREHIDLAILDVMLPDVDGFTLCRKIREKYFFPVIMLTAKIEASVSFGHHPVLINNAVISPHAINAPMFGITIPLKALPKSCTFSFIDFTPQLS